MSVRCPSCGSAVSAGVRFCTECGTSLAAKCPGCGAAADRTARFCGSCGASLAAAGPAASGSKLESAPPTPAPAAPAELPSSFGAGRYQIRRFLGEGGRKRVYQAYDRALEREVALATVRTEGLDEAGLERVRREAQAMARLGDHPHVVTVFDIGEEHGRPFIVSQYMPGGSVDDLLAQAPEHRLPVPEAVRIAAEICQALEHAHALGIIHRDIKPANVWLTQGGSTRLGDFGLAAVAAATSRSRLTKEGMMLGTVAYMAPEQALGSAVDARADLYSLGALLYELFTGRPPFLGTDALTVISQQINTPPMAPWWHNPDVPKELGTLVLELLAKTPEDRPPSAAEVRQRLLEARTLSSAASAMDADADRDVAALGGSRRTSRLNRLSRFVGRVDELRALKRFVDGALQGRGGLVVVSGEPGIGKTRLAEEVGVYARLGGAQVLTGRCYEAESSVPYMPFVEAIRAYVATRPSDELRHELGGAASDVARLVSDIRQRIPDLPPTARHEGEEERYRLFEAVSSFLVNASLATPIVLVLDDLHWADAPSLRLMQHLVRRLTDSRLLVVGTYRDVELGRRHPLTQTLVELRREHAYQRIGLQGLSLDEVREFLAGITEREIEVAEEPLVNAFYRETDGNPYFLEELVRHLLETGGAYWESGRWQISVASVDSGVIPEGIRDLIGRRLSHLSDTCNDVLTRAAALGPQFDFAVLERMTGLEEDPLLEALDEALKAHLVQQSGDAHGHALYSFSHAVVRQTLYEELSLPRRQRLHRRAAEAIETVYARNLTPHLPALALHFRQAGTAGDVGKAIDYSVRAGEAAKAVFAYEDAVRHWEAALELMEEEQVGDSDDRAHLLEQLGDLQYASGLDYDRGIEALERALSLYDELGQTARAAQMHSRLGRDLTTFPPTMDVARALAHFQAAQAILGTERDHPSVGYISVGLAATALWGVRTEEGLAHCERAIALSERLGNERLRCNAALFLGHHLSASGRLGEASAAFEDGWTSANRSNDAFPAFSISWNAADWCFKLSDPKAAQAWCHRELSTPRMGQAPAPRQILHDELARAHAAAGELTDARRMLKEIRPSRYAAPYLAYRDGRWEEARTMWEQQREDSHRRGNRWDEWESSFLLGGLHRHEGAFDDAAGCLEYTLSIAVDGGHRTFELAARAELALLLASDGRPEEAVMHLKRCRELASDNEDRRGLPGRLALSEAAMAVATSRDEEATEHFAAAVETFRRYTLPWDEAEALHCWGLARLEAGDRTGALEKLAGALDVYRRHGAGARWIERVLADKLRAQGIDPTATGASIELVAAAALDERPDLALHAAPDGTVTLLFSDIEGSTALNEHLGDERFMEVLHAHNQIVREQVAAYGGFEVKSQGDGFMVAFASARRALDCAIGIQRALQEHSSKQPEHAVAVRIGLHTGEVVKEGDDFFGKHVALSARVAAAARGGEILVSSLVKELADTGEIDFGPPRQVELKGISGARQLHSVLWEVGN